MENYNIKAILVPTDFSETADNAISQAIEIAKNVNAKLLLMHVIELTALPAKKGLRANGLITSQMAEQSKDRLKDISLAIKQKHGIKVDYRIFFGSVYENIIRSGHLFNIDLIVIGTHGTSGIKGWLFGSNAYIVVNNTTIPVLTINLLSQINPYRKIVFPFNDNLFTLKKIEKVIVLAKIFNSSILLFGYTESDSPLAVITLRLKSEELSELFKKEKISNTFTLASGRDYAQDIMRFAAQCNADLITVATNGSHNIDKILESKPYRKLVNQSIIPVLSVPVE